MKARTKGELKLMGKEIFRPNRKQGKTHSLCSCGNTKKAHYGNALGCIFRAGSTKNVVEQTKAG